MSDKKSKKPKVIKKDDIKKESKPVEHITEEKKDENWQTKAQEYLLGWQRAKADFENYKKDEKRHLEDFALFMKAGLILEILPILDSFEEALKSVPEK